MDAALGEFVEKFFLKRRTISLENWQIGLLLIVAILSLIVFGALVGKAATDNDAPGIAKFFLGVARLPAGGRNVVRQMLSDERLTPAATAKTTTGPGSAQHE